MKIKSITWDSCRSVWASRLWPTRTSAIESHSAMLLDGSHSMENMQLPAVYLGLFQGDQLVGVNSGHLCSDNTWRSRGLWVDPEHRGSGWGSRLLVATIALAPEDCGRAWSFPRRTSWSSYERAGFRLVSDWQASDTSDANAYCLRDI